MELLKRARDELRKMRDRFLDLVDPSALHVKVEEVLHHAVDEVAKLHEIVASLEARLKAIEGAVIQIVHAPAIESDVAHVALLVSPAPDAPPPSDESAAPGGAPADPPAPSSAPAGSEASEAPPPVIPIPLSAELEQNIAATAADPALTP